MKTYEVYHDQQSDRWRVRGLPGDYDPTEDQVLLHHVPYPETEAPEVETDFDGVDAKRSMHTALYDMYQWKEGLKEGDRFETPFGNFVCVSFHVVEEKKP